MNDLMLNASHSLPGHRSVSPVLTVEIAMLYHTQLVVGQKYQGVTWGPRNHAGKSAVHSGSQDGDTQWPDNALVRFRCRTLHSTDGAPLALRKTIRMH